MGIQEVNETLNTNFKVYETEEGSLYLNPNLYLKNSSEISYNANKILSTLNESTIFRYEKYDDFFYRNPLIITSLEKILRENIIDLKIKYDDDTNILEHLIISCKNGAKYRIKFKLNTSAHLPLFNENDEVSPKTLISSEELPKRELYAYALSKFSLKPEVFLGFIPIKEKIEKNNYSRNSDWYTSIIIREQMPGIDLENKIKEQKKLTIKEFENILRSSLDPIEEYHSQSISHNDTNVTNLIFNSSDSEKLKPSYIDWETTSKLSIDSSFNKWEQPQEIDFARMFIDIARNVLSNSHSQITPSDMKKVVNECVKYFELDLERTKKAYIGIADHYSPRFISWSYEGLYNNRIPDVRNTCHLLIEDL